MFSVSRLIASVASVGSARLVILLFPILKLAVIELVPALTKYLLLHVIVAASLEYSYPDCTCPTITILAARKKLFCLDPDGVYRGGETRSGTEKRCFHNLQSGHPAWWSADNYSIFPTVNILEARIEANRQRKSEMLKKLKKIISCNFVFLAYRICLSVLKCGGN